VAKAGRKARILPGPALAQITENLAVRRHGDTLHTCCSKCGTDLGPLTQNYKDHALREDNDIRHSNPNVGDYKRYIDERPVFRQFFCPGCGSLLENEIAREGDPLLRDIEITKIKVK
jgi:acetone carboxylase gamma subunit